MFKVFVRPIVDYCYSIYCPHTNKNIHLIESIQRNFTRRIICNDGISYQDRLKLLNLETLERRGIKNDLIKAYKIIWLNYGDIGLFNLSANKLGTRSNGVKLSRDPLPDLDCRKFFYSNRVVKLWNDLKRETVLAKNLPSFETLLDADLPQFASYFPRSCS